MADDQAALAISRTAAAPPVPQIATSPGHDMPAPSAEERRIAQTAFAAEQAADQEGAELLGWWAAGMLIDDFLKDAARARAEEKDSAEIEKSKKVV